MSTHERTNGNNRSHDGIPGERQFLMPHIPDIAPCGYICYDEIGTIMSCNSKGAEMLGYSVNELCSQSFNAILTVSGKIFFQTHLFPMVRLHGFANEIFLSLRIKSGGNLPVVTNTQQEITEKATLYHCIFLPIPTRRKYEDELLSAKKAAEEQVRSNSEVLRLKSENEIHLKELDKYEHLHRSMVEDLRQLSYILNHDMQESVRKIILIAGKIEREQNLQLLPKISMSAHRSQAIIRTLDLYVKATNSEKEYFNHLSLNAIMDDGLKAALMETDFRAIEVEEKPLPAIFGSRSQLTQLFYHLFSNSIKFREGEYVKISIDYVVFESNTFKHTKDKYAFADFIKLTFSDDGKGFDDTYNTYVFDLLKKLDGGATSGLGFGLSICKKIVANHMGEISVSSRPGLGTTVTLTLPVDKF